MTLKSDLNRLRRELATLPADETGGKWVLPWGSNLTADEQAEWKEYIAWVERTYPTRDIEAELATIKTINPTEEHP